METHTDRSWFPLRSPGVLVALVLIISGLAAGSLFMRESRKVILQEQEDNLFDIARSTDRNVANLVKRCQDEIAYLSSRTDFAQAEAGYIFKGRSSDLWFWLRDNTLNLSKLNSAVIAIRNGQTVLSSHMDYLADYRFFSELGSDILKLCISPEGKYYLAFMFHSSSGYLQYASLMDLEAFYRQIAGSEIKEGDSILLYNEEFDLLISNYQGKIRVDRPKDPEAEEWNVNGIRVMRSFLEDRSVLSGTFDFKEKDKEDSRKFVAIYPVRGNDNGIFSVAVVTPYDKMIEPLSRISGYMVWCGLVILAGLVLLLYDIMRLRQEQIISDRKVEELRLQNESMERLLQSTKELEHVQRLEMIGTMTSGIAHEFNNLLTPIMGYSIMTLEQIPEEETELSENVIEIYNASRKAKDVIRRLSELSRKNPSTQMSPLDPDLILRKAADTALPAKPKNVEIELKQECSGWTFAGNETQIIQLVLNLIINGFHAMEEEGGVLTLRAAADPAGKFVTLYVQDTGCGIPKDVLPQIFEPFYTTKEAGKGTGLGLAIVKNVVDQYNGSIEVTSEEGKGSTFAVGFPAEPKTEEAPEPEEIPEPEGGSPEEEE